MNWNFFHHTHDPPIILRHVKFKICWYTLLVHKRALHIFYCSMKLRFCLKLKPIFFTKNNTSNVILFLIALTATRIVQEIFVRNVSEKKEVRIEETTPEVRHRLTLACYEEARLPDRKCAAEHQIKADRETLFKSRRGRRKKRLIIRETTHQKDKKHPIPFHFSSLFQERHSFWM